MKLKATQLKTTTTENNNNKSKNNSSNNKTYANRDKHIEQRTNAPRANNAQFNENAHLQFKNIKKA